MANQGWPNAAGDGEHASSTDRQSGRGSICEPAWPGSSIAHPSGGDNDPLAAQSDRLDVPGQLSTS